MQFLLMRTEQCIIPANKFWETKMKAIEIRSLIIRKYICLIVVVFAGCAQEQKPAKLSQIPNTNSEPNASIDFRPVGDMRDYKGAIKRHTKAAELGDAEAQYTLGYMYTKGQGVDQNYKEAIKWFTKAAEQGYAKAQFALALRYYKGQGVDQNYKEAVKWLTKAAEQGYAEAQYNLASMYYNGQGVTEDYIEAYKWTLLAGMNGYDISKSKEGLKKLMTSSQIAEAQRLAKEYQKKQEEWEHTLSSINEDFLSSEKQKAKQGNIESQFFVGFSYYTGKIAGQDYAQAHKWFTMAAEQGNTDAQTMLAGMYLDGEGVSQDYEKAIEWFTKAANQGDSYAQSVLAGACYWEVGVTDYVESYKWLLLADKAGLDVSELKSLLLKDLTPTQIAEAQKRVKEFVEE